MMSDFLDYNTPAPPKTQGGERADIAALVMFLISGGFVTLVACAGSGFGGLCAILPFSRIGIILGVAGVRERRGRGFSVVVLTLNALALLVGVWGTMQGLSWLDE